MLFLPFPHLLLVVSSLLACQDRLTPTKTLPQTNMPFTVGSGAKNVTPRRFNPPANAEVYVTITQLCQAVSSTPSIPSCTVSASSSKPKNQDPIWHQVAVVNPFFSHSYEPRRPINDKNQDPIWLQAAVVNPLFSHSSSSRPINGSIHLYRQICGVSSSAACFFFCLFTISFPAACAAIRVISIRLVGPMSIRL
ncbi:hypothetical protein C8R44DRAFT_851579 [Mycena epipterygia]|nr:hypothetical protein C8R44DRAFT_851579 [Mycena epipterygia]